ncbi:hypothetical protein B296_00053244 [Ensete ventricosum]|uniref:Uncharacterized protein n=1 Tax=Ensete ventricosum TaxID=4639 RepID=A0A426X7F0_ENSVE|nr:hypothetical protein B296_00053244 [Ensete ventricosum]
MRALPSAHLCSNITRLQTTYDTWPPLTTATLSHASLFKRIDSCNSYSSAYCWVLPTIRFSRTFFLASSSYFFASVHCSFHFLFFSTDSGTIAFGPSVAISLLIPTLIVDRHRLIVPLHLPCVTTATLTP